MENRLWDVEGIELTDADRMLLEKLWHAFDPLPKVTGMDGSRQYIATIADKIGVLPVSAQSAFLRDVRRYFEQLPQHSPSWLMVSRWVQKAIDEHLENLEGTGFTAKQWCLYYYYLQASGERPLPCETKEDSYTEIAKATGFARSMIRKTYQAIQSRSNRVHKSCLADMMKIRPHFPETGKTIVELDKEIKAITGMNK